MTPRLRDGRIIGAVVMLAGIGFLAVITASVTAALVASARRRRAATPEVDVKQRLDEVNARLARIEASLGREAPAETSDGLS